MKNSKILIIGAGKAGSKAFYSIYNKKGEVCAGFVDDDKNKHNSTFCGLPVLGNRYDIPQLVNDYGVKEIIIAMPSVVPSELSKIIEICLKTNAGIKILPGTYDLNSRKIIASSIRDIQLEDLLGREPVALDTSEITKYLSGKVILVTGAGGSVGSELSSITAGSTPQKLVLLGHGENSIYNIEQKLKSNYPDTCIVSEIADIKDRGRIQRVFEKHRPEVVFHAAAHKHVPYMERTPEEAVKNNVTGTSILCNIAGNYECRNFILISTDKAVNPTSILGVTKKLAEQVTLWNNNISRTKFSAVRFGNVLGSRGSVIPLFERQIESGGPVTITHPCMKRYFMTVHEAAHLVIQAGSIAKGKEIFVLDMGDPICIKSLAYKLIKLKGLTPEKDIAIKYTGIRPGEKISESLVGEGENITPTLHSKIFAVYRTFSNYGEIKSLLSRLENPEFNYSEHNIRNILHPYYHK